MAFLFLELSSYIYAQTWPRTYDTIHNSWVHEIIETYDRGYLILGQVDPGFGGIDQTSCWMIKTDINGNLLWDKRIYNPAYLNWANDITQTPDGGFILIGSTAQLDPGESDIMFVKFDACGNREWCNVLSTPGNSDYGNQVEPVADGYIGLLNYYQDWINKRVWTIKLDLEGNVVWRKLYFEDDPHYKSEEAMDLLITPDNGLLVTAYGNYDPEGGYGGWVYSILIKTDSLGNEQWVTRWGEESGYLSLLPVSPKMDNMGNYYCGATRYESSSDFVFPAFIKTSPDGQELLSADLLHGTFAGITTNLHFLYPDTLIMSIGWRSPFEYYQQGVAKCDTNGNAIVTKVLLDSVANTFMGATLTFDRKYVLGGGFEIGRPNYCIYLFKINSNLELDSLYTMPRTYDSLCPHPIVSDTIDMEDCGVYTALVNPELMPDNYRLKAFPVPAKYEINFSLPNELRLVKTMNGINIQTFYHQWDKTTLQVFNLSGHLVYQGDVPQYQKEVTLDCTNWQQGMYMARLMYKSMEVGEIKVMVVR